VLGQLDHLPLDVGREPRFIAEREERAHLNPGGALRQRVLQRLR